ncbi:MAG: transcription antitermination factor NusB [Ilumatobacteraceae bacterium]
MESGRRNRQPAHDPRTDARERALHVLYEARAKSSSGRAVIEAQVLPVDEMTADIVGGVDDNVEAIDLLISNHAVGWTLARMPVIDVSVLRMATFELVFRRAVPTGVIINEAVELVKRFSTDESPRFVNGVLSAISREVRQENN